MRFLNEILVSSRVRGRHVDRNIPFSKEGAVPVFGLDIGFTFDLGKHFFIGVDTGIRYQSAPASSTTCPAWRARRQRRPLDRPGRRKYGYAVLDAKPARGSGGREAPPRIEKADNGPGHSCPFESGYWRITKRSGRSSRMERSLNG